MAAGETELRMKKGEGQGGREDKKRHKEKAERTKSMSKDKGNLNIKPARSPLGNGIPSVSGLPSTGEASQGSWSPQTATSYPCSKLYSYDSHTAVTQALIHSVPKGRDRVVGGRGMGGRGGREELFPTPPGLASPDAQ